jgi:dihydroneopterin aldolase
MADMGGRIVIERLEFLGCCGVSLEERARPQPLAVDLDLACQLETAGLSDNLAQTIDYAAIAQRIVEVGTSQDSSLLETVAERILAAIFSEFPIDRATLWIRKLQPPIPHITGSVGVTLERTRLAQQIQHPEPVPAPFLMQHLARLPKGRVLDVAAGRGRHALFLASQGYDVVAVDRDAEALDHLTATARQRRLSTISTRIVDLELPPAHDPGLGVEQYDVILVFFYLYRSLFSALIEALKPGGVLMYETFTIENYFRHHHPRRWEFCLATNELLRLVSTLRVLHYDEGEHEGSHGAGSAYTAQLLAQKPAGSSPTP